MYKLDAMMLRMWKEANDVLHVYTTCVDREFVDHRFRPVHSPTRSLLCVSDSILEVRFLSLLSSLSFLSQAGVHSPKI
jgi:hypothetical protein